MLILSKHLNNAEQQYLRKQRDWKHAARKKNYTRESGKELYKRRKRKTETIRKRRGLMQEVQGLDRWNGLGARPGSRAQSTGPQSIMMKRVDDARTSSSQKLSDRASESGSDVELLYQNDPRGGQYGFEGRY